MLTRKLLATVVLAGILATACSDSFSVEDALGIWDVQRINGRTVPGDVWMRDDGDSAQVSIEAFYFEFLAAPDCSYTIQAEGQAPSTNDDCTYGVTESGDITMTVNDLVSITGSADGNDLTLTDDDTNVFVLRKRTVPVASVEVTPPADTVRAGETIHLTATLQDMDGDPLTGRAISWASDDETVATVDNTGRVTGENTGVATITATSESHHGTAEVTVWVGVTGSWSGTLNVEPDCQLDLAITEAGTGAITGTSQLFAPCFASPFTVTGTNNTGGVADSVVMAFASGGTGFSFQGMFDGDATMTGVVYPGPYPATITRQSLTPAPPAAAAARADARSTVGYPLMRRTPGGR